MNIFVVFSIARQIDGEYVLVRTEGAFTKASKADELLKKLKGDFAMPNGKVKVVRLTTPMGDVDCYCEAGAHEMVLVEG